MDALIGLYTLKFLLRRLENQRLQEYLNTCWLQKLLKSNRSDTKEPLKDPSEKYAKDSKPESKRCTGIKSE